MPKFLLSLICFAFAFIASAQSQTTPVPWSGTRDKSCEVYHSAKYKTPIYSAEAMNEHLTRILGVDNSPKLFYRWERPVRYYLEVPSDHPELAKVFEEQIAQVAKYTGLDIARHDKPYLKYNDEKRNNRSQWPQGLNTNVMMIVTKDVRQTVQDPLVVSTLGGFGITPQKWLNDWSYWESTKKKETYRSTVNYSFSPVGLGFVYNIAEPTKSEFAELEKEAAKLRQDIKREAFEFASVLVGLGSKSIPSIKSNNANDFTDFDKQFLRVLYGQSVKSGMVLLKAKRLMHEELVDCFNAKSNK
jgi:hypothetical protein